VEVGDAVEHWFPGGHVADIKQVLSDVLIGSLEASFDACRRFVRELDRHLYITGQSHMNTLATFPWYSR